MTSRDGSPRLVQRAYRFALAPTPRQARALMSHAGGARAAYNWGLARIAEALVARRAEEAAAGKATTKRPGHFDLCKMWTANKDNHATTPDADGRVWGWVPENAVATYQSALRDADRAIRNFFDSRTGRRSGRAMGFPRFKSRHRVRPGFQLHGAGLRMTDRSHVALPRIGTVKVPRFVRLPGWNDRNGRAAKSLFRLANRPAVTCPTCRGDGQIPKPVKASDAEGRPAELIACTTCKGAKMCPTARVVRASVTRGASGTWWCSITAEVVLDIRETPTRRQQANGSIGLDLGTRYIAVDSEGTIHPNPAPLEHALAELRTAQRALSRTQKDSRRREKARRRVGAIHERVALIRKDSADRLTTKLTRTFALVAVEGWNVTNLAQHGSKKLPRKLRQQRNRALADAAPGTVRWQLAYKASWRGCTFFKGEPNWETGRMCSACGTVKAKPVPPAHDMFTCESCGATLDRRVNSARVIRRAAHGELRPGPAAPVAGPAKPRGEDVRPETPRRGRRSPVKRAARSRSPDRRETGISAGEPADIPTTAT